MPLTSAGEVAALNAVCTGRYVSLHTAVPTGGAEVAGGGYARQSFPYTITGADPSVAGNNAVITFPTATANWGTVTHVGIYSALTGGTLIAWSSLTVSKTVSTDDVVKFSANSLTFTLD